MTSLKALWFVPLLFLSACDDDDCDHCDALPRPVSIEVEVFDPVTQFVWEGVTVSVVEADQEWSGLTHVSPNQLSLLTDSTGRVFFDEFLLAAADVGFIEDVDGRALLGDDANEDEATVVLVVSAEGFTPVTVLVDLSWEIPDVFVSVPFN